MAPAAGHRGRGARGVAETVVCVDRGLARTRSRGTMCRGGVSRDTKMLM